MKLSPCIVGFDFGTTSLSAIVISLENNRIIKELCYTTNAYISFDDTRRKEQSLLVLSDLFYKTLDEIHAIKNIRIVSYGFTGQMHGIIGLNNKNQAVTNLVTWQDKSGSILLPSGMSILEHVQSCSGEALADGYGIITLYKWVDREKRADIAGFCTVADYFAALLAQVKPTLMDATNAHSIGLFNSRTLEWNWNYIEELGLTQIHFPQISIGSQIIGHVRQNMETIPVVCAIGDNQASFLGSVINPSESILLNAGTGAQLSCLINKEEIGVYEKYTDGFETQLRPYNNTSYLLATSFINGGSVYKSLFTFFKEIGSLLLGVKDIDDSTLWKQMETAGQSIVNAEIQLQVSPLLDGQRKDLSQKGSIEGLTATNFHPSYFITGFLKGLAEHYKSGYFPELKARTKFIYASGNGVKRNTLFRNIIEKTFECPLYAVSYNEEAAVGAALNGAMAIGIVNEDNYGLFLAKLSEPYFSAEV